MAQECSSEQLTLRRISSGRSTGTPGMAALRSLPKGCRHTAWLAIGPGQKGSGSLGTGLALHPHMPSCWDRERRAALPPRRPDGGDMLMDVSGRSGTLAPVNQPNWPQHKSRGDASLISQAFGRRLWKMGQWRQPPCPGGQPHSVVILQLPCIC